MNKTTTPPNPPMATICVSNLPSETREADILELFSDYGSIHHVRLSPAQHYRSMDGQGHFDLSPDDVERAIAAVDGKLFKGAIIRVSHAPPESAPSGVAKDHPAPAAAPLDDEVPSVRRINQYQVAAVEKTSSPEGGEGENWFRYVLSSGRSQITGLHRGTLDEVTEYAAGCAELVNSRSAIGKSARTYAPSKKK